jgi:broad specificity phosphatase PhoE
MAGSNEVLLVRHGETDENAAARFQGRLDTRLNARGREQSRALAAAKIIGIERGSVQAADANTAAAASGDVIVTVGSDQIE